eukprot:TRINITY_DN34439_c0_g1_i1.p1 TRINITY_DN34439_c0_g1~~TRINITY_DN34439_c0_g1_i1.p1  ORF type:complete len:85 (-),score=6.59 TRINITY_DN34439_c0_g1_i1:90-344(-)
MNFGQPDNQPPPISQFESQKLDLFLKHNTYTRLRNRCFSKCVIHYQEDILSEGQSACMERCASKYYEVQVMTINKFKEQMEQMG